jgi:hypothetical protein
MLINHLVLNQAVPPRINVPITIVTVENYTDNLAQA